MDADDLVPLCKVGDVAPGSLRKAEPAGCEPLAVYNVEGCFYVTSDTCTHGEASLCADGALQGHVVECGWHYGAFDVRTGEPAAAPCVVALRTYKVVLRNGEICIHRSPPEVLRDT